MKEYILDTNALLRYLRNDIPTQADEVDLLFQSAQKGSVNITIYPFVILEALFVLWKIYENKIKDISSQLLVIVNTTSIDICERDAMRAALTGWSKGRISFVDSYLLFQSIRENKAIFTFDKKLKKIAKQVI